MDLVPHHPNKQARRGTHPAKLRRKLEPNFRHYFFAREGRIGGGGEIFDMKTSMHCIKNEERIEVIQLYSYFKIVTRLRELERMP